MVFSVNQNRNLYVVNAYSADGVTEASDAGTIGVKAVGEGNEKELFFTYKGADTVLRTDRIPLKNLNYAKAVPAEAMRTPLKKVEVTLSAEVNSGDIVAGQDYVLRINFRQFFGLGDKNEYVKDAAVHGTSSMTASNFYKKMVESLNAAFSRELGATKTTNPYLKFSIKYSGGTYEETDSSYAGATATGIVIEEKIQKWTLGIEEQQRVYFDVNPTQIYLDGDDPIWGVVADATPALYAKKGGNGADKDDLVPNSSLVVGTNAIGNGHQIADLEWFCAGERGDIYRMAGYPNYIPTQYMITNPEAEYNVLELHFAYTDEGVNDYRSEKDITIVAPTTAKTALNNLIGAINTKAGTSIATL